MTLKVLQKGFNYSQDGPGNRLVYHLQGCQLHCPWCSNPESIPAGGVLLQKGRPEDTACPFGAVKDGALDRAVCARCESKPCAAVPGSGLVWSCAEEDIEALLDEAGRSRKLFFDGGGVTLTGGDPFAQFEATAFFLARLKEEGIHTAVETNGCHPRIPELFGLIDFLMIDCKHYDSAKHAEATGAGNETVLANIYRALEERSQLLIRIPLIEGFNAGKPDAEGFAALFEGRNTGNCQFELLRYHEYGKDKWVQCGLEYTIKSAEVSDSRYRQFRDTLAEKHFHIVST